MNWHRVIGETATLLTLVTVGWPSLKLVHFLERGRFGKWIDQYGQLIVSILIVATVGVLFG